MADMTSESGLREKIARVIYDDLEGPVANQDFCRQQRQWEQCLRIADSLAALISPAGEVSGWQPIETAPRDAVILLYGLLDPHPQDRELHAALHVPKRVTGYWDEIDGAWCPVGSTWTGPWFEPSHWMPLPAPPRGMEG